MESTETRATSTDPDGDRITVTLSVDVEVEVRPGGRSFYGYAMGDFDFGDEPLFCAYRTADFDHDFAEGEAWHARLNSGGMDFGAGPYADSLRDVVVEAVREALLLRVVPWHESVPPAELPWEEG